MTEFTLAAFNAHWGVGRFGLFRGVRFDVARLVQSFASDVVVVAESWRDEEDGPSILDPLKDDGYAIEHVPFMRLALRHDRSGARDGAPREGIWELAVCTRFPVTARREITLGHVRADPVGVRPALSVTVDVGGRSVEVVAVHTSSHLLSFGPVRHMLGLRRRLDGNVPDAQVVAGDFNFWGPPVSMLFPGWQRAVRGRTYPGHRPHSQIDHVLVRGGITVVGGEVLAATPSDHRPVRARLDLR